MESELATGLTCGWGPESPDLPAIAHLAVFPAPVEGDGADVSVVCLKAEAHRVGSTQLRLPALAGSFSKDRAFLLFRRLDQAAFRPAHPPPYFSLFHFNAPIVPGVVFSEPVSMSY